MVEEQTIIFYDVLYNTCKTEHAKLAKRVAFLRSNIYIKG